MIDWQTAERVAGFVGGASPSDQPLPGDLVEITRDSEIRVRNYTGMTAQTAVPPPESVSRREWISANLRTMRPMLDPLTGKVAENLGPLAAPVRVATGLVLAAQVGALTGYLAQRVLGQYDLALLDAAVAPRLLFVAPNLNEAAGKLEADREELLRWVAFHEVTHAVQFTSVPWLRDHLGGMLREMLASLEVKVDTRGLLNLPRGGDLRELVETIRKGDLVTLVLGSERRAVIDRLQATMAVIEGHAEHVMDAVGADVLPHQERLREALEHRRENRTPLLRLFERLLGLELKMRQYRDGKRFCDRVVASGGIEALNRVWTGPSALPDLAELADPAAWAARTAVPSLTA
ncbi:MAG: zinc-dependent metalloprotease [Solirubrobacteraceae bacterium]